MEKNLEQKNPDLASKYVWTRPRPHLPTVPIDTFDGVHQVLTGPDFSSAYDKRLFEIVTPTLKLVHFFSFHFLNIIFAYPAK